MENEKLKERLFLNDLNITSHQQDIFNEIITLKHKVQQLAGFIQNDFDKMLKDNTITKNHIEVSIAEMDNSFIEVMNNLNISRQKCKELMKYYCK